MEQMRLGYVKPSLITETVATLACMLTNGYHVLLPINIKTFVGVCLAVAETFLYKEL